MYKPSTNEWLTNESLPMQSLFITMLLGSKAKTILSKQLCCIQTEQYMLYRNMTIYGHFSI